MFNIEQFKSTVRTRQGLLKTNKYTMSIIPPTVLRTDANLLRDMEFLCDQVTIPGVNLAVHDVRRYGYGVVEKRPYTHNFTDINVTFLMTGDGNIHKIIHDWISAISPFNMNNGINSSFNGTSPYLMEYKSNYITDLRIKVYTEKEAEKNQEKKPAIELVIREAFPVAMNEMTAAWGDLNNIARLGVTFVYTDWFLETNNNQ